MASMKSENLLTDCLICVQGRAGRDPRRLNCKHSFCYQCLKSESILQYTDRVQCPVCWETTSLSPQGIAGLPSDDKVDNAMKVLGACEELYHCRACKVKGKASRPHVRCSTCDREMCEECAKKHVEKHPFSDHLIIRNLCKVHVSDYTHACLTCQSGLCLDCIESELHEGHNICDVNDVTAKAAGVLSAGKNILQSKIHELENLITVTKSTALDKLNNRRKETGKKLELYRTQLQRSLEEKLNKREEQYHKTVASALEKQNQACSEAVNVVNEIDNLSRDNKMNVISNLSMKTSEMYKALNALNSALSSPLACPELGDDICTTTEDSERGEFEFKCTIGEIMLRSQVDLKAKPKKRQTLTSIGGEDIQEILMILQGPDSTVIVCDDGKTQATRINMKGEVEETYKTMDDFEISGIAFNDNTVYIISDSGETVAAHTGGQVHISHLRPQIEVSFDMDTDGESLLIVEYNEKLLRYSFHGELLQQFDTPGLTDVSCAVHPDAGPVYLVLTDTGNLVHVLRQDGGRVISLGWCDWDDEHYFNSPSCTTMLPNWNILVAYYGLHRVSEFTFDGVFIIHLLTIEDGLSGPTSLCVSFPYLWVGCKGVLHLYEYSE